MPSHKIQFSSSQILILLVSPAPAPVPRCSPFIFINKLAEWTNVWSDSNPYFPGNDLCLPCETYNITHILCNVTWSSPLRIRRTLGSHHQGRFPVRMPSITWWQLPLLFRSVFVTAQPLKISLHNFYEFVWLLKTGIPRMLRILAGTEPFIHDSAILGEGYQHHTPWVCHYAVSCWG